MDANVKESTVLNHQKEKFAQGLLFEEGFDAQLLASTQTVELAEEMISKYIEKIKQRSRKRLDSLIQKQLNEVQKFQKLRRERKAKHEKSYNLETSIIDNFNCTETVRADKVKNLEANFREKLDQLHLEMDTLLNDIKRRHKAEIDQEEKEAMRLLCEFNSWTKTELFDNLQFKEASEERMIEMVDANSCSKSVNNLKEQNAYVPNDRDRDISGNDAPSNSPIASQNDDETMTVADITCIPIPDSSGVQRINVSSAVAADEVELITASMIDELSAKNPALQTEANAIEEPAAASERCTDSTMEQRDEVGNSTHNESMDIPSTMNPHVVQQVTNQHQVDGATVSQEHVTSHARLNRLNDQHVCAETSVIENTVVEDMMLPSDQCDGMPCNTSDPAVDILPPEPSVPLATTVAHCGDLTQPSLASCGVLENQLTESSLTRQPCEASAQEVQRPLSGSVETFPRSSSDASDNRSLHIFSHFENHAASRSFPATISNSHFSRGLGKEIDPLQKEHERISGEFNQVSKNNEDLVSSLELMCDKEIDEVVYQIRKKYESMLQEAEASYLQKKNELDHNQRKVLVNMALAETFRHKCIDHRTEVPSKLILQLLQSQFTGRSDVAASAGPQTETTAATQNVETPRQRSGPPPSMPVMSTSAQAVHPVISQPSNYSSLRSRCLQPQMYLAGGAHFGPHHIGPSLARPVSSLPTCGSASELLMQSVTHPSAPIVRQPETQRTSGAATSVVCLSDDE